MLSLMIKYSCIALVSFLCVGYIKQIAMKRCWFDIPNTRSLHHKVKPRGGGLPIVILFFLFASYWFLRHEMVATFFLPLLLGGGLVAAIGFYDDLYSLSAWWRLLGQCIAGSIVIYFMGGLEILQVGAWYVQLGRWGALFTLLAIVWLTNLYNFMDGMDGLAASEAIFVSLAAGLCSHQAGVEDLVGIYLAFAALLSGFLIWNWAPAKIFLGDVGSSFIGFIFSTLVIVSANANHLTLAVWMILLGVFLVDATYTLLHRLIRGEKIYQAHRSHAYQKASKYLNSHAKVVVMIQCINLAWLLPLALASVRWQAYEALFLVIAYAPLIYCEYRLNAGGQELKTSHMITG